MAPAQRTEAERVYEELRRRGGTATVADIASALGVHRNTVRRQLQQLAGDGIVVERARGKYQLARQHLGLSRSAMKLVEILETARLAAHLTGFDLLAPDAHQHMRRLSHLVYAEPLALESTEFELEANDLVVLRAEIAAGVRVPESVETVVLRGQPDPERYSVYGHVASREKAWVDALRESSRRVINIEPFELGRLLRILVDRGADMRFLRRYATQLGYADRVRAATEGTTPDDSRELHALRAGYTA
ncbi:HTH domain-containing protein [Solirubrobacter ginsenosidimutans]|uniref:HTH domain-containing protein n=1 Tax=Solirubrobacter ginsenosidimutans TaxID=490573 RepID=A0A9X3S000_9ACTN|nr:helix-turn-helix domain-containing protein [Solirubrobacter ginsenosidimutans]MDA0160784.1 HTH domain-containing protein [Solirubrobacter ginsenosidimutans]